MRPVIGLTKTARYREDINDLGIRAIMIPAFGIGIPLITNMIPSNTFNDWEIKFSFLYTIFIAFVIYQGTRYLHLTVRTYFNWLDRPVQKIITLLITIPFYTVPVSVLLLVGWYKIFLNGVIDWPILKTTTLVILIAVMIMVHVYETIFLIRQTESDQLKKEQLERSKVEAELEALKNQIDPHFIFNSLNTLSHLIEEEPLRARLFNDNMADVYRYILHNKSRDLVLLQDELNFLSGYVSMLKIRFYNSIEVLIEVSSSEGSGYFIVPISLQLLMENAVKHNEFSTENPLKVNIKISNDELVFQNPVRTKMLRKPSSKIGLSNLKERYFLITKNEIRVNTDSENFKVSLPLLKIA